MDDLINDVNRHWSTQDPLFLAAYVLWKINDIHPFINGNGRTARATAYFIICIHFGGMIRGTTTLPQLLKRDREEYVAHLRHADQTSKKNQRPDLEPLRAMIERLLIEQMNSVNDQSGPGETPNGAA
jgi:Fic family protein